MNGVTAAICSRGNVRPVLPGCLASQNLGSRPSMRRQGCVRFLIDLIPERSPATRTTAMLRLNSIDRNNGEGDRQHMGVARQLYPAEFLPEIAIRVLEAARIDRLVCNLAVVLDCSHALATFETAMAWIAARQK